MKENTDAPAPIFSVQGHTFSANVEFEEILLG